MHGGLSHWEFLLLFRLLLSSLGISLSHSVHGRVEVVELLLYVEDVLRDLDLGLIELLKSMIQVSDEATIGIHDVFLVVHGVSDELHDLVLWN